MSTTPPVRFSFSVLKASCTASEAALRIRPQPLDHAGVVVAVGEIVIQRGETMLLAGPLHIGKCLSIEVEMLDVAPVVGSRIHGETGSNGTVGADDYVVLSGATVP